MLALEPLPAQVGSLIQNRYELIDLLGHGATGVVYRALDHELGALQVAIKILHPHLLSDELNLSRFRQEVLLARRLSHPNIVKLFEFDHVDSKLYYIVFEFVRGTSLAGLVSSMRERRVSIVHATRLLFELCSGVAHAHAQGIIHRDIKPQNVLLDHAGHVRLCDFGLSRAREGMSTLTQSGDSIGTPAYMAPEQFRGEAVDERADIYSLGILGYELVSGALPFTDESFYGLAIRHLNDPIPPLPPLLQIPDWYRKAIEKAASKDKDSRYQSVDEMRELFEEQLDSRSTELCKGLVTHWSSREAARINAERRRRVVRIAKALGFVLLGAALTFLVITAIVLRNNSRHWSTVGAAVLRVEERFGTIPAAPFRLLFSVDDTLDDATFRKRIREYLDPEAVKSFRSFEKSGYRIRMLIAAGVDTNIAIDGDPILVAFAKKENEGVVAALLQNEKTDPNVIDSGGYGVIHRAIAQHSPTMLSLIMSHPRADLNLRDSLGQTAVHLAVHTRNTRALSTLLGRKAVRERGCKAVSIGGITPLELALTDQSLYQARMVDLLLPCSDVQHKSPDGKNAASFAVHGRSLSVLRRIYEKGVPLTDADSHGFTPLHYAVWFADVAKAQFIIRAAGLPLNSDRLWRLWKKSRGTEKEAMRRLLVETIGSEAPS